MTVHHLCAPWPLQGTKNMSSCQTRTAFPASAERLNSLPEITNLDFLCVSIILFRQPHTVCVTSSCSQLSLLYLADAREKLL